MTKREELEALAERVERAEGADRELDAAIALACGIVRERDGNTFYGHKDYSCMVLERGYHDIEGSAPELPAYTASLDAAMGLVPEGYSVELGRYVTTPRDDGPTGCWVRVSEYCGGDGPRWEEEDRSTGATLELATVAAALRARAAGEGA